MKNAQIITVNKQRFVAGLFWQTLTRPRAYLQEAKDIGRREKMDVVAIRRGRVLQAGFAKRSVVGAGAYSFAAALAGMLGDDWIAVFELDADRYVIAAAKNGAIIPGCDEIGPRVQIEDSLRTQFNLHQFSRVICPSEFNFGGEELDLLKVLQSGKLRKEYRLQAISGNSVFKAAAVGLLGLLILGALVIGVFTYRKIQQDKVDAAAAAAAAIEQQRLDELKAASGQEVTAVALTHPWALQPKMSEMRESCVGAINEFPLSIGGWLVDSATCSGGLAQAIYRREPTATINGWTTEVQKLGYRIDAVDEAGESGTLSITLDPINPGGDDALIEMAPATNAVRSLLQSRSLSFSLVPKPVPPPPPALPGEEPPPAPPLPDWQTQVFTITGKQTPADMVAGMEDLPAIRLDSVSVKRAQSELEWSLTGEIHGK